MPTKYGLTYHKLADGRTVIQANATLKTPKITIQKTSERNLDYFLMFVGSTSQNMPNTRLAFEQLYNRVLEGAFVLSNTIDAAGLTVIQRNTSQTGVSSIIDRSDIADFTIIVKPTALHAVEKWYNAAQKASIVGQGLTSGEIAALRQRDTTLDALTYVLGHEIGGHLLKAGFEGQNHDKPVTFQSFYDDTIYRAGWDDAYAAGVPVYMPQAGGDYYYFGNAGSLGSQEYWTRWARIHTGSLKTTSGPMLGLKMAAIQIDPSEIDLSTDPTIASGEIGMILGSALGRYMGGGNFGSLVTTPLLTAVGQNVAQFISAGGLKYNAATAKGAFDKSFGDFSTDLKNQLQGAALGTISSLLALELGNSLGLTGFGSDLVTTGVGSVFNQVLNNSIAIASTPVGQTAPSLFSGLDGKGLFGKDVIGQGPNIGLINSAFASFFGAKLGSLILSPINTEGAVLSSVGASLGAWAFGAGAASSGSIGSIGIAISQAFQGIGNFVAPLVGSLIGFVLGSLIGRLFGRKKPRVPTANADALLAFGAQEWALGQVSAANGGNQALVKEAASITASSINNIIAAIVSEKSAKVISDATIVEKIGHTGATIWVDRILNGVTNRIYSGADADRAVEVATIDGMKRTKIAGGDIFMKRAVYWSQADNVMEVFGDIQTAQDYSLYLANISQINSLILQSPTSQFAVTWSIALQRAAELHLTDFAPSDFAGGLGGFGRSFGFGTERGARSPGKGFEYISLASSGTNLQVSTTDGSTPFSLLNPSNGSSVLISNLSSISYAFWAGQATAGNDIWIASNYGYGLTIDDTGTQYYGYWDPYYGYYYQYPVTVTGGDDIFVGTNYNDAIYGRAGWDWLDGGAGNDIIDGGDNDDVILGGVGSDRMMGGNGNDYIAGGDGDDYFFDASQTWGLYGGDGDDTFVGGAGLDSSYGENGNDLFIIDQDGGGVWDAIDGQAGSDTVSFERFNSGVYVDFAVTGGWSWNLQAKSIYGDSIANVENVTGSQYNDTVLGDDGANVLKGLGGNDYIHGRDGNDVLEGGLGADTLDGGNGFDIASYSEASQGVYIDLTAGIAKNGDAEGDVFYSIEGIRGSAFADDIRGDAGDNILSGLGGDDIFRMTAGNDTIDGGDGFDTLDVSIVSSASLIMAANTNLYAGQGVWSSDGKYYLTYQTDGNLVLYTSTWQPIWASNTNTIPGVAAMQGDGNLVVYNSASVPVWYSSTYAPEASLFIDGSGRLSVNKTDGSEAWANQAGSGLTLYFDAGYSDPYYGYYPGAGWIAYASNLGTTTFSSIESFVGTAYADSISGDYGDEVYEGGAGNDNLYGSGGSDTYIFNRGDGQDSITEANDGANAIVFGTGINWRDVALAGAAYNVNNGNLTVSLRGTSDQMVIGSNFSYVNSGSNAGNHNHKIKSLSLDGLSTIDITMIDWTPIGATSEAGTTVAGAQNRADVIFAYGGNDTIYLAGNSTNYETRGNVVYAGDGNDTIYGSYGDDQYVFEVGNGVDTLTDTGGLDTIIMGPSVSADDVIYKVVGNDLYIGIRNPNDPNQAADLVADRIRVVNGGLKQIGMYYGGEIFSTTEYVRVGGQEIDLTKADIDWTISYYDDWYYYYPVALDLDGDGIELRSVHGSRIANVNADGTVTRLGWLGQDDGFLALDRNGDGVIDRIGEISFIGDVEGAKSDLEGLTAYDSNGDGKLDATDKRWGEFRVWQDKNQDGFGSKDELVSLDEAGVRSISLKGQATGFTQADGLDNIVLATADIEWTDENRIGSAHDVALARFQVRTDGGDKALAEADAKARGVASDDLDPLLYGVQSLSKEQADAIRTAREQSKAGSDAGLFYRIESLMSSDAVTSKDSLYKIDPKAAAELVSLVDRARGEDTFAKSQWTLDGSTKEGERDTSGDDAKFTEFALSDEQKQIVAEARKLVAEQKSAAEAQAKADAARDAASSEIAPAPAPPSAEEQARLAKLDKFRLLTTETDEETAKALAGEQDETGITPMLNDSRAAPVAPNDGSLDDPANPLAVEAIAEQAPARVAAGDAPLPDTATLPSGDRRGQSSDSVADDPYGVIIRTANARLVQALASFGEASSMMAGYQGLNGANDTEPAWLTVDAMPSIQRLASIR